MKKLAVFLTLCLVAAGAVYFNLTSISAIGEMQVRREAGEVFVHRDGESIPVKKDTKLEAGDFITTGSGSEAILRLVGERTARLGGSARVTVVDEDTLEVQSGSLLAPAALPSGAKDAAEARSDRMKIRFNGITATSAAGSRFRIDRGFGTSRAATYRGSLQLTKPGQPRLTIPAYFEASMAASALPGKARPYQVDDGDGWDTAFLADEIVLDEELTQYAGGLATQLLGGSRPSLDYFSGLAGRRVGFMKPFMRRPTQELLIGFTVADNAQSAGLAPAFERAFGLRDDGGRWGIVAAILRAKEKPLVADLRALVADSGVVAGSGSSTEAAQPQFVAAADAPGGTDPGGGDGGGGGGPGPGEPIDPGPGGGGGGDGDGNDEEPEECTSGADCTIQEVTGELEPEPDPSPSGEAPDLVDGALDI